MALYFVFPVAVQMLNYACRLMVWKGAGGWVIEKACLRVYERRTVMCVCVGAGKASSSTHFL